jgi:sigma-B regulation protein RsbU (phosphoserine phosphatase)
MSSIQATLRALVGRTPSLGDLAERASDLLFSSTGDSKYATAALVDLDPTTGDARYVSAGHVDSLLIRAGGDAVHLGSTARPLGLLPPGLPFGETGIVVQPGDCLVLYSDGVPDAQNEAGEDFGEERLADILRGSAHEPAEVIVGRVFDAIDRFAGAAEQFDDITLMILRRSG